MSSTNDDNQADAQELLSPSAGVALDEQPNSPSLRPASAEFTFVQPRTNRKVNLIGTLMALSGPYVTGHGSLYFELILQPGMGPRREVHLFQECEYYRHLSVYGDQLCGTRLRFTRLKPYKRDLEDAPVDEAIARFSGRLKTSRRSRVIILKMRCNKCGHKFFREKARVAHESSCRLENYGKSTYYEISSDEESDVECEKRALRRVNHKSADTHNSSDDFSSDASDLDDGNQEYSFLYESRNFGISGPNDIFF